jgi:hypothetical protein
MFSLFRTGVLLIKRVVSLITLGKSLNTLDESTNYFFDSTHFTAKSRPNIIELTIKNKKSISSTKKLTSKNKNQLT